VNLFRQIRELRERLQAAPALDSLLASADPAAPLADRVQWAERCLAWIRRDQPANRLRLLFQILDRQHETQARVAQTLRSLVRESHALDLFAETGLPRTAGFFAEAAHRLFRRLVPQDPAERDLAARFERLFPDPDDSLWLESLDEPLAQRLADLWQFARDQKETAWDPIRDDLEDALILLAARIRVIGSAPDIRHRLTQGEFRDLPFQRLSPAVEGLILRTRDPIPPADFTAELRQIGILTDACDRALDDVTAHLEEKGVSTAVVYDQERLRFLIRRLELLLVVWADPQLPPQRALALVADLVREHHGHRSVRALAQENLKLFTRRLVERTAETGEHYIARNSTEYWALLRSALGGGALTGFTTLFKLSLTSLAIAGFLEGTLAGLNYAVSFVLIQLFGFTLATKQPASTAPALAGRMNELRDPRQLGVLVDEIVILVRSQMAAMFGNLVAVAPAVWLLDWFWFVRTGHHFVSPAKAQSVVDSLSPLSGTWFFAAGTGVLLWFSSLIAGWADNAFALYQLRPALATHPRLLAWLGTNRAGRFAAWLDHQIAGLAGNISLGFLLGLTPEIAKFLGLPWEVRHVTLSTGQLTAAVASLGSGTLSHWPLYWTLFGVLGIGVINLAVSFTLALFVAIRARDIRAPERRFLYRAVFRRWISRPWTFLIPWGDRRRPQ